MDISDDCIFCKIVNGIVPSFKIYEDDSVFAFLDINPASYGHTLIIPKEHYSDIYELPTEELKKIIEVAKRITMKYKEVFGINAVNLISSNGKCAQQDVFHFHLHIIPRDEGDNINLSWKNKKDDLKDGFEAFIKKLNDI